MSSAAPTITGIPLTRMLKVDELLPLDTISPSGDLIETLSKILVTRYEDYPFDPAPGGRSELDLTSATEVVFDLPGLDGFALVVGGPGAAAALFHLETHNGSLQFGLGGGARLRFPREWLKPVVRQGNAWVVDPLRTYSEVDLSAGLLIDEGWSVSVAAGKALTLPPSMIGDTGFVIEGTVLPNLSTGQRGVTFQQLRLSLPPALDVPILPADLSLTNFHIGSGGISGSVSGTWSPTVSGHSITGPGAGTLFGVDFGLRSLSVALTQGSLTGVAIGGVLGLPFFDHALDVKVGLDHAGEVSLAIGSSSGIESFSIAPGGVPVMDVALNRLSVKKSEDDDVTIGIGGKFTPKYQGLAWPTFDVKELSIDSDGHVRLEGGWLDLPEQYSFDLKGFRFQITKLGFGHTEDGGKWAGFSGGLKLVDGIPDGASVEGLRLIWYDDGRPPHMTLNGVGVEFQVPKVLKFKGDVSYDSAVNEFAGDIRLELISFDLELDAKLVFGQKTDAGVTYPYFAIYLGIELPAGIPLFSTGLALYGMAGLFGNQMRPKKTPEQEWYTGWYKTPSPGVDSDAKWKPERGSLALGAGVTVGTAADNGYTFSGRLLLVIVFPGPIVLLEGMANLLKPRASLANEPTFRALAVLDKPGGTFVVGLDAKYAYGAGGELIDVRGGAEASFNLKDASDWHLYLGERDPREKRIRAQIFKLFEANAYLMIKPDQLATGAWLGYEKHWSFGPLKVDLEAWIDGNAVISFKPPHLHGDLWLHGAAALKAFKYKLRLVIDARVEADVFDPFHVKAEFNVALDLPEPLPDFDIDITLEWGPDKKPPPLPLPLKDVAVEHFKVTTSWPLARGTLLRPNLDNGSGFWKSAPTPADPPASIVPIVPLDARPHITFGRTVNDDALVGVNAQAVEPEWEQIGNPKENEGPVIVRYGLKEIALEKKVGGAWQPVARQAEGGGNPANVKPLFGSWANTPQLPSGDGANPGQSKLWLWSKSAFDYARNTSGGWNEWFAQDFPSYPCIDDAPDRTFCWDFEAIPTGVPLYSPWTHPALPKLVLGWGFSWSGSPSGLVVRELASAVSGLRHALCFPPPPELWVPSQLLNQIRIDLPEPAKVVELTVFETPVAVRACIDFRQVATGTKPNPWTERSVTFEQRLPNGALAPNLQIAPPYGRTDGVHALGCGELSVTLPCAAGTVELLVGYSHPVTLFGFDDAGNVVATAWRGPMPVVEEIVTLRAATGIKRVLIRAAQGADLFRLCYECIPATSLAAGFADIPGWIAAVGNTITISAKDASIRHVLVRGNDTMGIARICATFSPATADVTRRSKLVAHQQQATATWGQTGEVLEPYTEYRLKIFTTIKTDKFAVQSFNTTRVLKEFAYFRTDGPPGLAQLTAPPGATNFDSGLGDLQRYVRQTIPPTVPEPGEPPRLPRPVFRAYDVGAEFDVDYVDLMYRLAGRDLALYLYDNDNRPARDAEGRLIVLANTWGTVEAVSLSASDTSWLTAIEKCNSVTETIPKNRTLTAEGGPVLDPDTVYEARLVPLLMHEAFADLAVGTSASGGETLGRWTVHDAGTVGGPSKWEIWGIGEATAPVARYVTQTSGIKDASTSATQPLKAGTVLLAGDAAWTDYRVSAYLRSATDGAVGLVFRRSGGSTFYRVSLDRAGGYRRLIRLVAGTATVLAEDDFVYRQATDYLVTVEAVGDSIRVYQDSELVFDVTDSTLAAGQIGLYAWNNSAASFSDVRVDDFRGTAPVVYRFKFTTSRFANFHHLLHSFEDEPWPGQLPPGYDSAIDNIQPGYLVSPTTSTPPSEEEARTYESIAGWVLGEEALQDPPQVEVTRVDGDAGTRGLLVRSPEPLDPTRTSLAVASAAPRTIRSSPPHTLKLTDATFSGGAPNDESVSVLLRNATDVTGARIELRRRPGLLAEPVGDPFLLEDDFDGGPRGLVYRERFGPNALDHYTVVDQGTVLAPSTWTAQASELRQGSRIHDGSTSVTVPAKRGTVAILEAGPWHDLRVRAQLRTDGTTQPIGVVFRYRDDANYYRFSMEGVHNYRRLVKCVGGIFTTLWEDGEGYSGSSTYEVVLEAFGDRLVGYLEGQLLFSVHDGAIDAGRVGFYTWHNGAARFPKLEVETLEASPLLWRPPLLDLSELEIVDDPAATGGPSDWFASAGTVTLSSDIASPTTGPDPRGTYAIGGRDEWTEVAVSVRLSLVSMPSGGSHGVLFRYVDDDNYYRFSIDPNALGLPIAHFRLVRRAAGVASLLWELVQSYDAGSEYALTISARGPRLEGVLSGPALGLQGPCRFRVHDRTLAHGRVGLYANNGAGATFAQLAVHDPSRTLGRWRIHDDAQGTVASAWTARAGTLLQAASVGTTSGVGVGTHAVAGDDSWGDYQLTVRLRSDSGEIGVLFRYVDDDHYYRLSIDNQARDLTLTKRTGGVWTPLGWVPAGYGAGVPFSLTVRAVGDRITASLDGTTLFERTDSDHRSGGVGLHSRGSSGARFEHVQVERVPVETTALFRDEFDSQGLGNWDTVDEGTTGTPSAWKVEQGRLRQTSTIHTPPNDRDSLAKHGTNALGGELAWGDVIVRVRLRCDTSSTLGVLFRYRDSSNFYRFSMDRQRSYRRLVKNVEGTFTLLWEDRVRYVVGTEYELTIVANGPVLRGYLDGIPLFVVEDPGHESGQIGLYTWDNGGASFSGIRVYPASSAFGAWRLDERFDSLVPGRWTFVDDGTTDGPSAWTVASGMLTQTSGIHDGVWPATLPRLGTSALAGDPALGDYRFSVLLGSLDNGAIGVFVRYVDAQHWYRFSIDRASDPWPTFALVKNVGGTYSTLVEGIATDGVPLDDYYLTVDCEGDRLVGYLNAQKLFDVNDSELATGRVGLYAYRNPDARFLEARLAAPVWATIYRFAEEPRLPAGTLVRVYSGNAYGAPAAEPNVLHRFAAPGEDFGRRAFDVEGAALRIVRPDGSVEHERTFVPESEFAPADVVLLRKADGTGFVVLPQTGTLAPADYRLALTYRRRNTSVDAESLVLKQAGDDGDEVVRIDVPWYRA